LPNTGLPSTSIAALPTRTRTIRRRSSTCHSAKAKPDPPWGNWARRRKHWSCCGASYSRPSLIYHHLANSYTRLANCLLDSGDRKVAAEYYRKAVNARLTLAEKSPGSNWNRGSLAECYTNLAKALGPDNPGDALKQYNKAIELLDPLTAADRSNVTVRIALADALSNAARLHVQMAGRDEEPSTRLEDWNRAKSFYERSLGLWLELERTGKLPPDGNVAMNNVRNELARCNDSVAKLQQVH